MFCVNDDMSIYVTRGDTAAFRVTADGDDGKYIFQAGDVVRFKVTEKKACENVMFYKDFPVTTETEIVDILLTEEETKIGDVISKPTDYWYEIELNPFTNPQTIVGYDEDGAKVFKLFPEGNDVMSTPVEPEDIPVVDDELDATSKRPVENQAVASEFLSIRSILNNIVEKVKELIDGYAEIKKSVSDGKEEIAAAITYQKVDTAIDLSHYEMAANIRRITRGTGNATSADVLKGKTFTNDDGIEYEGDIPVRVTTENAVSIAVNPEHGENGYLYTRINYGYYPNDWTDSEDGALLGLSEVKYPLNEVEDKVGFTDYKNAIMEALQYSGLEVSEDTSAEALKRMLADKFPKTFDVLSDMRVENGVTFTPVNQFVGEDVSSEYRFDESGNLLLICIPNNQDGTGGYISATGSKRYYLGNKYCLTFTATFDVESTTDKSGCYVEILVKNSTGTIASYKRAYPDTHPEPFTEQIYFTSDSEVWVEVTNYSNIVYNTVKFNISSMTLTAFSAGDSFEVQFGNAKNLMDDGDGRYYMSLDTYGTNWKVSDETTPSALATGEDNLGYTRVFYTGDGDFFRTMASKKEYVFLFTAPLSGNYNIDVNAILISGGGYADIYVNDVFMGTIDTYNASQKAAVLPLGMAELKAGEYANKIKIVPTGASSGSKAYASIAGFTFTAAE